VLSVQRLWAHARLDEWSQPVARARAEAAAGDESWAQWVSEWEQGQALIIRLELEIEFQRNDPPPLTASLGGFFIEIDPHRPKVEHQIAELASGEFVALAEGGDGQSLALDLDDLALMYVHVELDRDLKRHLGQGAPPEANVSA
jgi:hypothetical protein